MLDLIRRVTLSRHKRKPLAEFTPGDTIEVSVRVKEGEKERIQIFKGIVLKMQGSGIGRSFTVRKISDGVGVERTFPFASPSVEKVEVISRGKVRRGKLYYLRGLEGKKARISSEWAQVLVDPAKKAAAEQAAAEALPADAATEGEEAATPKAEAKDKKSSAKKAE